MRWCLQTISLNTSHVVFAGTTRDEPVRVLRHASVEARQLEEGNRTLLADSVKSSCAFRDMPARRTCLVEKSACFNVRVRVNFVNLWLKHWDGQNTVPCYTAADAVWSPTSSMYTAQPTARLSFKASNYTRCAINNSSVLSRVRGRTVLNYSFITFDDVSYWPTAGRSVQTVVSTLLVNIVYFIIYLLA